MSTARYDQYLSLGGEVIQSQQKTRTFNHANPYVVSLAPGKVVTSWVKTDADTASATLPTGHGYVTGTFDVYWTEAGVNKLKYGASGTVTGDSLALDLGTGDDYPASATTGIVVCQQTSIATYIDGDAVLVLGIMAEVSDTSSTARAHVDMQDVGAATIEAIELSANDARIYDIYGGDTNVFTGNIIESTKASNGSSTDTITLKILSGENS